MKFLLALFLLAFPMQAAADCAVRGMALQALANERFPVEDAARELSKSSCPGFEFLWSTFGSKYDNVRNLVHALSRPPHVSVYALCGPCRSPRRSGKLETFFPKLQIGALNRSFRTPKVLSAFRRRARSIARLASSLPEVEWTLYPELERNLSPESFRLAARELSKAMRRTGVRYKIGDNPGPIERRPLASPVEQHGNDLFTLGSLRRGDSLSLDGSPAPLSATAYLAREAASRGVDLYLWKPEWQGLVGPCRLRECTSGERLYRVQKDAFE